MADLQNVDKILCSKLD